MKLNIDTLIYLLVVVIFGILGAIGNRKKPSSAAAKQDAPDENDYGQEDTGDVFSQNLRKLMGDYEQYDTENSIVTDEELELEMAEKSVDDRAGMIDTIDSKATQIEEAAEEDTYRSEEFEASLRSMEENISDTIKMGELGSEQEAAEYYPATGRFLQHFDMRKAIIYSEILNPKYF